MALATFLAREPLKAAPRAGTPFDWFIAELTHHLPDRSNGATVTAPRTFLDRSRLVTGPKWACDAHAAAVGSMHY